MKKFLSILLAAVLVLSLSATAFATEGNPVPGYTNVYKNDAGTPMEYKFEKLYTMSDGETPSEKFPAETLTFTVVPDSKNPAKVIPTLNDHTVSKNPSDVVLNVPAYNKLGVYKYTIKENAGDTQGVIYNENDFILTVTVSYVKNEDGSIDTSKMEKTVSLRKVGAESNTTKTDKIVNIFEVAGPGNKDGLHPLTVDKTVSGNLANPETMFDFSVKFTSDKAVRNDVEIGGQKVALDWTQDTTGKWTAVHEFKLSANMDKVTVNYLPKGVQYEVAEAATHADPDTSKNDPSKGYTVTYNEGKYKGAIEKDVVNDVVVNNHKGAEVDTGITLDVLPYVIILGIAVLSLVLFTVKRRVQD